MRFSMISIRIIAGIYALLGAASAWEWLYAVLFTGTRSTHSGFLDAVVPLGLAYGLVTFRPWARTLGLVISGLIGFVGVLSLILWLGLRLRGIDKRWSGLIVDRPVAALILIALLIAFAAWQWWVLTRPQVHHLFSSKPALG
jgi:hypothetical protein